MDSSIVDVKEQERLNDAREAESRGRSGTLLERTPVGTVARTTARTATPGTSSPTTMPARVPIAGARTASPAVRRQTAPVLRAGPVEREGSHPQRASLRLTNSEGNHGEDVKEYYFYSTARRPLVHEVPLQVSAGGLSYADLVETNRRRTRNDMDTSSSTPASSTRTATSTCSSSTQGGRKTCSCESRQPTGTGPGRAASPADAVVPKRLGAWIAESIERREADTLQIESAPGTSAVAPHRCSVSSSVLRRRGALLFTENATNNERLFPGRRTRAPTSRTASTTAWCRAIRAP